MTEMNFELLKDLYCVFSPSMKEEPMRRFIKQHIKQHIPDAIVSQDSKGNLLITKGEAESFPCLCAHMDQVQNFHPEDFTCIDSNGVIFGYSPQSRSQCGLGADDKNGIFIALTCLERYDNIKCAFFVGEEIGCVGSEAVDISFFSDCRFCVQIDRRGNSDMVTRISYLSLCSHDFIAATDSASWGYGESIGLMTDVESLKSRGVIASCINLSCGYYEPHSDYEFTVKEDVRKCYAFVCHIIEHCTGDYSFPCAYCDEMPFREDVKNYNDQLEDCFDYCIDLMSWEPELTEKDFFERASCTYTHITYDDIVKIFQLAKVYLKV